MCVCVCVCVRACVRVCGRKKRKKGYRGAGKREKSVGVCVFERKRENEKENREKKMGW